jgi:membrane protein DedA with SNARE-associated domain
MDRAQDWFERRGRSAVFVGRIIPGVRTFISLPAGFSGMPMTSFIGYSALGTLVWTAALAFAGRLLGSQYERVGSYLEPVSWLVIGSIVLLYIVRLVRQNRTRGAESKKDASSRARHSLAS